MTDLKASMYVEAHVTLAPVFGAERQRAEEIAGYYRFKLARLYMLKEGPQEVSTRDTFMTGHDTWLPCLQVRVTGLVRHLQREHFTVLRYKIEDTIMDSRSSDVLGLLATAATGLTHESPGS